MSKTKPPINQLPFEVVVETYGPTLLRFCIARLGPDLGEEAFQETLLSALANYDKLEDTSKTRAWLFAISRNKMVDVTRKQKQTVPLEDSEEVFYDPQPNNIWSEVAKLPQKQREAVGLRYLADLPYSDIAHVMGVNVAAARRNVFEGLKSLRENLTK